MELILISNKKLKIMLSEEDMEQYGIGGDADCADSATRRAIRSLLERARDQIGFKTDGEEIFVQLYTSKKGGCELFVTKSQVTDQSLPLPAEEQHAVASVSSEKRQKRTVRLPERQLGAHQAREEKGENIGNLPTAKERDRRIAFSFPSLKELLAVCKALSEGSFRAASQAFTDGTGGAYLLLLDPDASAYAHLDRLTFVLEYGRRENPDRLLSYINEYGRVICPKDAVKTLGDLF